MEFLREDGDPKDVWQRIGIVAGAVYEQEADVIVNSSNNYMRGGGGVDAAIHRAAGVRLLRDLMNRVLEPVKPGDIVTTPAFDLPYKAIIHVSSPIWQGGLYDEEKMLEQSYIRCLGEAHKLGYETVAFPSLSTGNHQFPLDKAAPIALQSVCKFFLARKQRTTVKRVIFALFDPEEYRAFVGAHLMLPQIEDLL
jgi:O-acetyl-ADP-ribose deacetylase (regulator of RNase III)